MFSYWYLNQLGILYHGKESKDDKILVISALSFLNMFLSLLVFYLLFDVLPRGGLDQIKKYWFISIVELFVISASVSYLLIKNLYSEGYFSPYIFCLQLFALHLFFLLSHRLPPNASIIKIVIPSLTTISNVVFGKKRFSHKAINRITKSVFFIA